MKLQRLLALFSLFVIVSCNKTKEDVDNMNSRYESLKGSVDAYEEKLRGLNQSINELQKIETHLTQLKNGKTPVYILLLNVHQSNITLDISQHIKNSMNSSEFEIPVSEEYYNNVSEGSDLSDSFRVGSFLMRGSWGNIKVTVKKKEIKYH